MLLAPVLIPSLVKGTITLKRSKCTRAQIISLEACKILLGIAFMLLNIGKIINGI